MVTLLLVLDLLLPAALAAPPASGSAAPPAPPEPVHADWMMLAAQLCLQDGQTGLCTLAGGDPANEYLIVTLGQAPEGFSDPAFACEIRWSLPATQAVDTTEWPRLWPGAAFRIDTGTLPTSTSEGCARLDPERFGADPVATIASAGWTVGFGPMTPSIAFDCQVSNDAQVVLYAWMDGALPEPVGMVNVQVVSDEGVVSGEEVAGANRSPTLPDGWFALRCGIPTAP
ncbi:hypothetical protein L6R53_31450 [Myxococcota bacterium]|nr:hypothetical protein [Myxococcota bacterium]